ncbi:sensor histidine kinase [Solihabitans fulvus]|nr:histidine kinase [Solihabitans fulvus]
MPIEWISRVARVRFGVVRVLLPFLCVSGYLLLLTDRTTLTWVDWSLALASAGAGALGGLFPLSVALTQVVLFAGPSRFAHDSVSVKVMVTAAMLEVAARRWGTPTVVASAALTVGFLVTHFATLPATAPMMLFQMVWMVGAPVLVGAYLNSQAQLVRQAQERAAEAKRQARLAERTSIAREIHDLVAHHVASMVLRVGVAQHVLPDLEPEVARVLQDVHTSGTAALADLRRLIGVLRNPSVAQDDLGSLLVEPATLPASLRAVVERGRGAGVEVVDSIDPAVAGLDAVRGLAVLRLVQEGLTNVGKHAGPSARARLVVRLGEDGAASVEIRDEGGAERAPAGDRVGHGLVGMRERVELVGGRFEAGPDGSGWRLAATLPAVAGRP